MSSVFLGMTVIHRRKEKQILCKIWDRVFVCFDGPSRTINNSGGYRGGARLPPYFWTKLRPEEKFFQTTPPYLRAWMTAPPLSQGLDPTLNKLVFEGQLQKIHNRGDMWSIRKQYLLQLAHLRKPPYITVSLKTRRRLNPFLYRFLKFFTLLSFFSHPPFIIIRTFEIFFGNLA